MILSRCFEKGGFTRLNLKKWPFSWSTSAIFNPFQRTCFFWVYSTETLLNSLLGHPRVDLCPISGIWPKDDNKWYVQSLWTGLENRQSSFFFFQQPWYGFSCIAHEQWSIRSEYCNWYILYIYINNSNAQPIQHFERSQKSHMWTSTYHIRTSKNGWRINEYIEE